MSPLPFSEQAGPHDEPQPVVSPASGLPTAPSENDQPLFDDTRPEEELPESPAMSDQRNTNPEPTEQELRMSLETSTPPSQNVTFPASHLPASHQMELHTNVQQSLPERTDYVPSKKNKPENFIKHDMTHLSGTLLPNNNRQHKNEQAYHLNATGPSKCASLDKVRHCIYFGRGGTYICSLVIVKLFPHIRHDYNSDTWRAQCTNYAIHTRCARIPYNS